MVNGRDVKALYLRERNKLSQTHVKADSDSDGESDDDNFSPSRASALHTKVRKNSSKPNSPVKMRNIPVRYVPIAQKRRAVVA